MRTFVILALTLIGAVSASIPEKCFQAAEVGPCKGYFKRYHFDAVSGQCQPFIYGGCSGNSNNFETVEACKATCECSQPKKTGNCEALIDRFYYDTMSGQCQTFEYGGCGGNSNNFITLESCKLACEVCVHKGVVYAPGESFKDDCNTCTCGTSREAGCTKMACGPIDS